MMVGKHALLLRCGLHSLIGAVRCPWRVHGWKTQSLQCRHAGGGWTCTYAAAHAGGAL